MLNVHYPGLFINEHGMLMSRSSHSEVFSLKGVLKMYIKFTGEQSSRNVISIHKVALQITLRHGCSPITLRYTFGTTFSKSTYE